MLSDGSPTDNRAVVVSVPGIHATYTVTGVQSDSLEPKLIHSWIKARQKNSKKVKAAGTVTSPLSKSTSVTPAPKSHDLTTPLQRKLPPIVSLYSPTSQSFVKPRRKTVYSNYMDNLQSPTQNKRSRLKWDCYYHSKAQDKSSGNSHDYDFINFVGSPILSREKCMQTLQLGKDSGKPVCVSKESSTVSPSHVDLETNGLVDVYDFPKGSSVVLVPTVLSCLARDYLVLTLVDMGSTPALNSM